MASVQMRGESDTVAALVPNGVPEKSSSLGIAIINPLGRPLYHLVAFQRSSTGGTILVGKQEVLDVTAFRTGVTLKTKKHNQTAFTRLFWTR